MTFLAPAVLGGLIAVAAPIAIHLLNRRKVIVVRWGATRFLVDSLTKNQRRLKVEDLLLLLLRCLLIALLALAFARPVLNPGGTITGSMHGPAVEVLLLDQSASMQQSDGLETRFAQAQAAARKELECLIPGSQAALFLVTDHVNQIIARPTTQLILVRHALDLAQPTDRVSDLSSAVKVALETLRASTGAKKQILVFTDNQRSAWPELADLKSTVAAAHGIDLKIVAPIDHGEDNLAITTLKPATNMVAAGQPIGCVAEVSNFGHESATAIRVTLSVDDGPPIDETVIDRIEPGKSRAVQLNANFPKPGYYTLTAAIGSDRFPPDNRRSFAVKVIDHLSTVIIEGDPGAAPQDRSGFFLANALAPITPSRRESYYLKIETQSPAWLAAADLTHKNIVFLCDVPKLDPAATLNLQHYVRDGGGLVIFPGPRVRPAAYNDDPVLREMLPARLGELHDLSAGGKFAAWQKNNYGSPITSLWNDERNGNLGNVRASKYFPLTVIPGKTTDEASHVVVAYADETPAVVEKSYGKGHVVLFSSTATTQWNNFPIHPDFVPLLQRLVAFVAPNEQPGQLNFPPGATFQVNVASDLIGHEITALVLNEKRTPRPAGKVELLNQQAVIRYRDTERAGAYRFFVSGSDTPIATCAVQIDPAESDLQTISPHELGNFSNSGPALEAPTTPAAGVRRELWTALILAAGLVALVEMYLAHRFSFAK